MVTMLGDGDGDGERGIHLVDLPCLVDSVCDVDAV